MPLLGVVGGQDWRYAWLVFPLAAALLAGAAVIGRRGPPRALTTPPRMRQVLEAPGLARWLAAEMLTNTAWAGTLVYAGALFAESYQASTAITGTVLAIGAGAHVSGNLASRRLTDRAPRRLLILLSVGLALAATGFGTLRPSLLASTMIFSVAAFAAGARALLSSAYGLTAASEVRPAAMAMRAASMQFGYFLGSLAAGTALALGGYAAFGATIGALFLSAAPMLGRSPARAKDDAATARHRLQVALNRARA